MRVLATAPAKLFLIGEYAVVEGAPAVVTAVNRRVEVEIRDRPEDEWTYCTDAEGGQCRTLHLDATGLLVDEHGVAATEDSATRLLAFAVAGTSGMGAPALPRGLDVAISSRALHADGGGQKLGLGSSAAVMVALGSALRRVSALTSGMPEPGRAEGLRLDLAAHRRLQGGRGSGADVAASVHGGIIRFQRDGNSSIRCRPLGLPPGLHMRCFWTGRSASTSDFLAQAEACQEQTPEVWKAQIQGLTAIATAASDAFENANAAAFLEAAADYAKGLIGLGDALGAPIVSGPHRALSVLASRHGAVYKPSGAGGGDIGVAFGDDVDGLDRLLRDAVRDGYPAVMIDVDPTGVEVLERC